MNHRKPITLTLLLALTLSLPFQTLAVDTLPPVPVSDSAIRDKEVGITILGYTVPGFGWDTVAIIVTKKIIERVVDSTVNWINTGFEGNPGYVTDLQQYFSDLADGIAGEYIAGSDLNFLCSPFQAKVRLALLKSYNEAPPFQCRLTDTVKNIEAFYKDFSAGGWTGWFAMTQNDINNPYGSYLEAKIELDERIAKKIGLENQKLEWGRGFLSWQDCVKNDPRTKECLQRGGPIKTPGTVVEGQLAGVLGSGMRKLELADEFDELVGALLGQLLEKSVFSIKGLFGAPKVTEVGGGGGGSNKMIDIDGDGITDGIDTTGDGQPDLCFFGGVVTNTAGPPCKGSKDTGGDGGGGENDKTIDIDGDGIVDAIDLGGDGTIDRCIFGGTPPDDCKGSKEDGGGGGDATSLLPDLKEERAKYPQASLKALCPNGSGLQPDTCPLGAMLNAVAWKNRDKGWGLSGKAGGHRCSSPAGIIACDILQFKSTLIMYDVFGSSGKETKPTWNVAGQPNPPDSAKRPWVAPASP